MLRSAFALPAKIITALTVVASLTIVAAQANEITARPGMTELAAARAPIGHVQFCGENAWACASEGMTPQRIVLDGAALAELIRINDYVNVNIAPVTDLELYGVEEKWTYPVDRGDCEDYALLKQRFLVDAGWPESALLLTVVRDEKGDGHAVLTVVTDHGDLVLDNQRETIMTWQETGYEFVKRQSQVSARAWVSLGGEAVAGVASAR